MKKVENIDNSPAFANALLGDAAVISWWSGGITSAVACRLALEKYPNVRLVYIHINSHHADTMRFKADCEKWYGKEIEVWQSTKYDDQFDVILATRYVNGAAGARCTKELKKEVRRTVEEIKDDSGSVSLPFGKQTVVRSFLSRLFFCKIMNSHEWTSNAQQGIPPTPEQLKSVAGFWDYAKMYCKRCGHISELSKRCLCKYKN